MTALVLEKGQLTLKRLNSWVDVDNAYCGQSGPPAPMRSKNIPPGSRLHNSYSWAGVIPQESHALPKPI